MSEEVTQTTTAETAAPSLTLNDLMVALNMIQVVAQRGAVRAEEMSAVGNLHDRLKNFLEAQGALTAPVADTAETTADEAVVAAE
jgi:hypothetical protein